MLDVLGEKWVEGLLLVSFNLKVYVAMAVLGLTICYLIGEVSFAHGLLMSRKYLLNEVLSQVSDRLSFQALFPFSILLCFLLKVIGMVKFAPLCSCLIREGNAAITRLEVVLLG